MSGNEADASDIRNRTNLYAIALDGRRWGLFDEIFADDVVAQYGSQTFVGLTDFRRGAEAAWGNFDSSQHAMLNSTWAIDGDQAATLTYGSWLLVRHDVTGEPLWEGRGWYDDRWQRMAGGWRIVHRRCEVSWSRGNLRVINPALPADTEAPTTALHTAFAHQKIGFVWYGGMPGL